MKNEPQITGGHEKFKELAALANSGVLDSEEWLELQRHLSTCSDCREISGQYQQLAEEAMPLLAATHGEGRALEPWDEAHARKRLLARIRNQPALVTAGHEPTLVPSVFSASVIADSAWKMAIAACLLITVGYGAYRLGLHAGAKTGLVTLSSLSVLPRPVPNGVLDGLLTSQEKTIAELEKQSIQKQKQLEEMRGELHLLQTQASELANAKGRSEEELRAVSQQRDLLSDQLHRAEQSLQAVQADLVSLRAEHQQAQLQAAGQAARIEDLTAANREQERRLHDDEQFLASDRDIRELMGARNLYIADVFDVDSGSRTRRPYGRVFYTQNRSLIFYAFDLDRQPGIKNANAFQVWGQREMAQGETAHPLSLGILYMDSESNRRWVLRLDDPKQLAEIDAVFVTVEPNGGSHKPTSKPFLYALLRREANHP